MSAVDSGLTSVAPALEFDHLSAAYGPYRALFDVSLQVPAGSVVALLGSNGAGKSTIARVATGLLPSSSGAVRVGGVDVTKRAAHRIARLGVAHVPEGRAIFSNLTVEENLALAYRLRAGRKKVDELLTRAYDSYPILMVRRKQRAGTLSGGQQRLLSLAKVLVIPPKLLIADELSLGLAPMVIDDVYKGLREINKLGTSLLVVEQQVDRVLDIADKAIIVEHGTVAYDGAPSGATQGMERILAARGERPVLVTKSGSAETVSPSRFGSGRQRSHGNNHDLESGR
jgi:branched-chain amino acid transport system ATP-binding protein